LNHFEAQAMCVFNGGQAPSKFFGVEVMGESHTWGKVPSFRVPAQRIPSYILLFLPPSFYYQKNLVSI